MESREINEYLETLGKKAASAKTALQKLSNDQKDHALKSAASALVKEKERLLAANEKDYQRAQASGMAEGLLDRLKLTPERIEARPVGIAELNPRYVDTYVRIDDVSFTESPAAWCDRDPESGRYTTTERTLTDAAGDMLTVRTAGTALYAGEPLPEGRGSLCGIVDCFNGKYTLRITGFETSFAATPAAPATAYP